MSEFSLRENYEIQKLLGTGGFGAVFSAKNLRDDKYYAVKVLWDTDDVVGNSSEIETFSRLPHHKNIVKYYSSWAENVSKLNMMQLINEFKIISKRFQAVGQAPDNTSLPIMCIQMELCEGDLRRWVTDKSKNANLMKLRGNIILQIAEGIKHLHDNNIIHRDLKPDNIFLNHRGSDSSSDYIVKIGDFGISKQHHGTRMAAHTANIGTHVYLAPEMSGQNYGKKIDWYSLGLIIYEIFYPDMQPGNNEDTFTELVTLFTQLKYDRKLPTKLKFAWPKVAHLIKKLTEVNVDNRGEYDDVGETFGPMTPNKEVRIENAPVKVKPPPLPELEKSKYILLKREFAIKMLLGTGSYGAVFKVRNKNNNRSYAIKLFAQTSDMDECLKEVKNYEQIPWHENVVAYKSSWNENMSTREIDDILTKFKINNERFKALFNFGEEDQADFLCIQMELCSEDLRSWLKANMTVDENKCKNMFTEIAEGTHHLHKNNLIHRDLKPDNIFLKKGVVKIGDLGISKWHTSTKSAQHTANFGTMMYLAPEMQCAQYGKMVDWWASGLILFELFYPEMQKSNTSNPFHNIIKGFNDLKFQRKLPETMTRNWPLIASLILKLTESNTLSRGGYKEIHEFCRRDEKPPPPPRHELLRGKSLFNSDSDYNMESNSSENIICGICKKDIVGVRYKCSICINLDLCEKCEKKSNLHSKEHSLVKITSQLEETKALVDVIDAFAKGLTRINARIVTLRKSYIHITCNNCKGIVEREFSYKCLDCQDFNMCQKCHKKQTKKKTHDEDHVFVLMYLEMECNNCRRKCDRFSGYQCMRCDKYDLCYECYTKEKNLHMEHRFVKFQEELSESKEHLENILKMPIL